MMAIRLLPSYQVLLPKFLYRLRSGISCGHVQAGTMERAPPPSAIIILDENRRRRCATELDERVNEQLDRAELA